EADTGRFIREFRHEQQVYNAVFSPDGTRIATGDASRKAHVWDVSTGERLFSLPVHTGGGWVLQFSSDGPRVLTGGDAANVRLWETSSGLPMSGWIRNIAKLKCALLSPDSRTAVTAGDNGVLRLWPVVRAPLPAPGWLLELAEALAGQRLRDD